MFNKKQEVIKLDQSKVKSNYDDNQVLFVRLSEQVQTKDAILEIDDRHDAIVIKGGGDRRYYKSGNYPMFDTKQEIKNWKNGLSVDVIFIAKSEDTRVPLRWGTSERAMYRDESSNKVITVGARGCCDVCVANPEMFYRKVVGVKKEFNLDEFQSRFGLVISNSFGDIFLNVVTEKHLTYDQYQMNKKLIQQEMEKVLDEEFKEDWGLRVRGFQIEAFDLDENDTEAIENSAAATRARKKQEEEEEKKNKKLKEYLAELERLDDKKWEREKYLRQLELEDKNAYYEVLKVIGSEKGKLQKEKVQEKICPNCGYKYTDDDAFCPKCGVRLKKEPIICNKCGHKNAFDAGFCSKCGNKLK